MTATLIQFVQSHKPPLEDGDYTITLAQEITVQEITVKGFVPKLTQRPDSFSTTRSFTVQGPRSALTPAEIHSVFPPEGSLGEHSHVLPHVVLQRSTLPWERRSDPDDGGGAPWLALLLFDAEEAPTPAVLTLVDLRAAGTASPWWPGMPAETGEEAADKVTVIDVEKSLLETLLPATEELVLLAHVRRGIDDGNHLAGDELAVIVGNRLPKAGAASTVHLVSVEKRYKDGSFDFQNAGAGDRVRLISLKSWSFACVDEKQSFTQLLLNLDPYRNGQPTSRPATLQLPDVSRFESEAPYWLGRGFVALPHTFREGSKSVSWYHGPLIPWAHTGSVELPVRAADALLRFHPLHGMFDVAYAAAWELGRLLTLQSRQISTSLYAWKRARVQKLRQEEQRVLHLPFAPQGGTAKGGDLEKTVTDWFSGLSLLQGVPFNYLVPDERMLPPESIRFFQVDPVWIDCLLDGAFSIGRVLAADHSRDQAFTDSPAQRPDSTVTGVLLRSEVVSGWPTLQVDGFNADGVALTRLRMDRLSPNVLICLFQGEIARVAIHQEPEALHFGFDRTQGTHSSFFKKLRDPDRDFEETEYLIVSTIPWRDQDKRILYIYSLAEKIKDKVGGGEEPPLAGNEPGLRYGRLTSAQFALQMVEGVEKVVLARQ